jgi:hypothetical protein
MDIRDDGRAVYLAINGHRMVTNQEDYDRGRTWDAQHAEECPCVDDAPPHW